MSVRGILFLVGFVCKDTRLDLLLWSISFLCFKDCFSNIKSKSVKWAFNKYKRFKRRKKLHFAGLWLRQVTKNYQDLFPHWIYGFTP